MVPLPKWDLVNLLDVRAYVVSTEVPVFRFFLQPYLLFHYQSLDLSRRQVGCFFIHLGCPELNPGDTPLYIPQLGLHFTQLQVANLSAFFSHLASMNCFWVFIIFSLAMSPPLPPSPQYLFVS